MTKPPDRKKMFAALHEIRKIVSYAAFIPMATSDQELVDSLTKIKAAAQAALPSKR